MLHDIDVDDDDTLSSSSFLLLFDDLDSRFLVLTNAINHFWYLTHSNTAFDDKGGVHWNQKSKLISVLIFDFWNHYKGGPKLSWLRGERMTSSLQTA